PILDRYFNAIEAAGDAGQRAAGDLQFHVAGDIADSGGRLQRIAVKLLRHERHDRVLDPVFAADHAARHGARAHTAGLIRLQPLLNLLGVDGAVLVLVDVCERAFQSRAARQLFRVDAAVLVGVVLGQSEAGGLGGRVFRQGDTVAAPTADGEAKASGGPAGGT